MVRWGTPTSCQLSSWNVPLAAAYMDYMQCCGSPTCSRIKLNMYFTPWYVQLKPPSFLPC